MQKKFEALKEILGQVYDINSAIAVLDWDHQTYMPEGGAHERSMQIGTLSELSHKLFTSEKTGELLNDLKDWKKLYSEDSDEAGIIKTTMRDYEKRTKVPASFVSENARTTSIAHGVWCEARSKSDFSIFQAQLEKIVKLRKEYASFFAPYSSVYDPLLDDFEPGLKSETVKKIFDSIKQAQIDLIHKIYSAPQIDDSFLHGSFAGTKQWDFGVHVISKFGFNWKCGRQDKSAHPFTTTFGIGDVRITTRILENYIGSALFSTMHEAGHAMYEQGISKGLERTAAATGASLAIHESQSRMWENLVGRSRSFWIHFYPELQRQFPQLVGKDLDSFWRAVNKVHKSAIRVEADEATYNLHVMLRFDLEQELLSDRISVADLPEAWNRMMKEYLGVHVKNDAEGVLQDVHWSGGMFGYFPTYALGNLVSAQLMEKIRKDIPSLDDDFERGSFEGLLGWLRSNIHVHGAKYTPEELLMKATGSALDSAPYIRYLNEKYSEVYKF